MVLSNNHEDNLDDIFDNVDVGDDVEVYDDDGWSDDVIRW